MTYYKNINELYKNEFNFPKFKQLKKYRFKLMLSNETETKSSHEFSNLEKIEHVDLLLYLTLITELIDINENTLGNLWFCNPRKNLICYGLMFQHSWILNEDGCYKLEFGIDEDDEELEEYIKTYEPDDLTLFRKYDICNEKLFDEFVKHYADNNLIKMIDSNIWKTIDLKNETSIDLKNETSIDLKNETSIDLKNETSIDKNETSIDLKNETSTLLDYQLIDKINWYLINKFTESLENAKIKVYNRN